MDKSNGVVPQWHPPSHLSDPYVRRLEVDRALWMRTMRGRIPKLHDRAVAMAFGTYGDSKGRDNFPGIKTLAEDLNISESTVKRSMSWLAEHGWIRRTARGNRWAGLADVWHLSLPAPVAAEIEEWSAGEAQWMERPKGIPSRPGVRDRPAPVRQGKQRRKSNQLAPDEIAVGVSSGGIGVSKRGTGVGSEADRGPNCDPPPEQHQIHLHQSENPSRPHADARGASPKITFDPQDEDYEEKLLDYVSDVVGGPLGHFTEQMVLGMASEGRHWRRILNAALAQEGIAA